MFEQAINRRRPLERSWMFERAGLHRTDLVASFPEISGRVGAGQGRRGRAGAEEVHLRSGQVLPWNLGPRPRERMVRSITIRSSAMICVTSSITNSFLTSMVSSKKPAGRIRRKARGSIESPCSFLIRLHESVGLGRIRGGGEGFQRGILGVAGAPQIYKVGP
jgi:hypothetical protein